MSQQNIRTIKVWDPLIRIFHWSLVFFFALAYLTEDDWMTIHSYAGYTIALLIGFRLIWGMIGTAHARFSDFVTGPRQVIDYLKQLFAGKSKRYLGHNPAGAAMILILLTSLTLTLVSGMSLYATDGHGPLATTFVAGWSEHTLEEIHEFFANFTLLMIVGHVAGVLVSSLLHRENLVKSMITGEKHAEPDSGEADHFQTLEGERS